jgi:hypothetical protein
MSREIDKKHETQLTKAAPFAEGGGGDGAGARGRLKGLPEISNMGLSHDHSWVL